MPRMHVLLLVALCLARLSTQGRVRGDEGWDPYAELGVPRNAGSAAIRSAFRQLSLQHHPDKSDAPGAAERFQRITRAYEVLSDPSQRYTLDAFGGRGFHTREEWQEAARGSSDGAGRGGSLFAARGRGSAVEEWSDVERGRSRWALPAVVKFYAPWCVHCQQLAPEFSRTAVRLDGRAVLAAVDCERHGEECQRWGVAGYPTVRFFGKGDGRGGAAYNGPHEADAMTQWAEELLNDRVLRLSDAGLQAKLRQGLARPMLLDFTLDQCGHFCESLRPEFRRVAAALAGAVDVGIVHCDDGGHDTCRALSVSFFPYLVLLPSGAASLDGAIPLSSADPGPASSPAMAALSVFARAAKGLVSRGD